MGGAGYGTPLGKCPASQCPASPASLLQHASLSGFLDQVTSEFGSLRLMMMMNFESTKFNRVHLLNRLFSKPMHGWPNSELHDSIPIETFQACSLQSRPTHRLTAYSFPSSGNWRLIRPSCGYPLRFRGSRDISATHGKRFMVSLAPHNDVPTGPSHWHLIKESAYRLPPSTSSKCKQRHRDDQHEEKTWGWTDSLWQTTKHQPY
jgi:hypothetical protein